MVQQHGKLSRYCNHRPLLAVLPTARGQLQAPSPQVRIGSKRPQNKLSALHQQPTQMTVSRFRNAQLRCAFSRLVLPRSQSQVTAYILALGEVARIFQGQHIAERGQWSYSLLPAATPSFPDTSSRPALQSARHTGGSARSECRCFSPAVPEQLTEAAESHSLFCLQTHPSYSSVADRPSLSPYRAPR